MNVISIDPGHTTGVCIAQTTPDSFEVVKTLEIPWAHRFGGLQTLLGGTYTIQGVPLTPEAVVIENFRLRPDKAHSQIGQTFPSSQIIGIVQAFLYAAGYLEILEVQEPGQRTRVKILDNHKEMVSGSQHLKDAYQHARYYWIKHVRSNS